MKMFFCILSLLLCPTLNAWAENVLVVFDVTNGVHTDARDGLVPKLTAESHTVTQEGSGNLPADLSPYDQLWDLRPNNAITAGEEVQIVAFLNSGKRAFVIGENAGYGAARNTTIVSLVAALGGGVINVGSPNTNTQNINSPWDTEANSITYPASGSADSPGNGVYITDDGTGAGFPGSAIAFNPGTMTNALNGTLAIVFDVNFLQPAQHVNPVYPGCEELTNGLVSYIGGELINPSTIPTLNSTIPTLNEWGMIILSAILLLGSIVMIRKRQGTM